MSSDFWEWILIILALVLVFGAKNLQSWKTEALKRLDALKQADSIKNKGKNKKD